MLNKAIQIAVKAHEGQVDKGENPYILHPLRVMLSCNSEIERICAVLHDVVEDTSVTLEDIRKEGFPDEIVNALDCLTRRRGESYEDFIERVLKNKIACNVKLADLSDNMDLTRISNPTDKDEKRIKKYRKAFYKISKALIVMK
ncbi:GTP pyrophosphokinase [Clostridium sp. WILCCON 0269]|uniref:GTP pyrophosphokinase n=1 Tax=Candidatus Clostridium eludens TaxID=3381663 RepID=A0ABW8SGS3_9CLOT